jgi:hypothetical protein
VDAYLARHPDKARSDEDKKEMDARNKITQDMVSDTHVAVPSLTASSWRSRAGNDEMTMIMMTMMMITQTATTATPMCMLLFVVLRVG